MGLCPPFLEGTDRRDGVKPAEFAGVVFLAGFLCGVSLAAVEVDGEAGLISTVLQSRISRERTSST